MANLINGLGGAVGFGEGVLDRNDDDFTALISITGAFPAGLNFFGRNYTGLYVNNNGSVTFAAGLDDYTPTSITGQTSNPIIAPFWADVDTRGGVVTPTPGGTSRGTDLVYYDQDPAAGRFTVTWDDVGYFETNTDRLNSFQLILTRVGSTDFDIEFRYEDINWVTGDASDGVNGLGGTPARIGYSSGNGTNFLEQSQSGNEAALLALETTSNVGEAGVYRYGVRSLGVGATNLSGTAADEVFSGSVATTDSVNLNVGLRGTILTTGPSGLVQTSGSRSGTDTYFSIEIVKFADGRMVFDASDPAAQVVRLFNAALGRAPDQGGLNFWIDNIGGGAPLTALANGFVASAEFAARYGANPTTGAFVELLYVNALGRASDPAGKAYWVDAITSGAVSRAQALVGFSESAENRSLTAPLVNNGIWDVSENAAFVARLYDTTLGRLPDVAGLSGWRGNLDSGALSRADMVSGFVNSAEFAARYGANPATPDFVELLYANALRRPSDTAGKAGWVNLIDSGAASKAAVVLAFSESPEHIAFTAPNVISENPSQFGILFA